MGGCTLNRSLEDVIYDAGDWDFEASELKDTNDSKAEQSLMPRVEGRLIKRVYKD